MANKKLLKTYHGIPKTPIDDNTVFYASMDGTTVAEVGGSVIGTPSNKYDIASTGLGLIGENINIKYPLTQGVSNGFLTLDFTLNLKSTIRNHKIAVALVNSSSNVNNVGINFTTTDIYLAKVINGSWVSSLNFNTYNLINVGINHFRIRIDFANKQMFILINGKQINTAVKDITDLLAVMPSIDSIVIYTSQANNTIAVVSDVNVSNIDRGSYFPTLPQDFIDGTARIVPAFNEQRQIQSDALTSEYKIETVSANIETKRQYTKTQATSGVWTSGDTVKVKGLTGEIISGVIDSDTALAVVTNNITSTNVIPIDDVSKFVVGESVSIFRATSFDLALLFSRNITAIDATNKTITLDGTTISSINAGTLLFDTTPSTSSPLVRTNLTGTAAAGTSGQSFNLPNGFSTVDDTYNGLTLTITGGAGAGQAKIIADYLGSSKTCWVDVAFTGTDMTSIFAISKVPVTGTWSNLGTNQSTFTLGVTPALTNQDLSFDYSLNEVAGQGGIPEVLTSVLGGEINTKIVDSSFVKISTDYKGKVVGSVVENANIVKYIFNPSLQAPSNFTIELGGSDLTALTLLDGKFSTIGSGSNTNIAQQLFSFDLIALVERKYGIIPAISVADKALWLKTNITNIICNWYGYGSCPSGNKAYLRLWANGWYYNYSNTTSTPSLLAINNTDMNYIDSNGFVHALAYTDASDGVTASTINTDYISLDVTLNYNTRLTLPNIPSTVSSRKLALNPTVQVTDDLLGANPNVIEYSTGDGKIHFEVEGETLDMYAGGVTGVDFTGKVSGSVVENPNISKQNNNTSLLIPSGFTYECIASNLDKIIRNDSNSNGQSTSANNQIPQQLFSFDLIKTYERKYGVIPSATQSVADKVAWLKFNVSSLVAKWYGYGSCPSGNKAKFVRYSGTNWSSFDDTIISTNSTPTLMTRTWDLSPNQPMSNAIQSDGFAHYLAYTDMASTTSPTLLVLNGHGLINGDIIENVTRSITTNASSVTTNAIVTTNVTGQTSGDIINKYHKTGTKTATTGTTTTNLVITAHGLSTGDYVCNITRSYVISKVTVIDANTLTLTTSITGQISGDSFYIYPFVGQQTAEATVIPSTIYTDYVSLDITLKPSYKSVGEDFGGVQDKRLDVLSRGKNLFDGQLELGGLSNSDGSLWIIADRVRSKNFISVKPNTSYTWNRVIHGSSAIYAYDKNKNFITSLAIQIYSTPSNCYYVKFVDYQTDLTKKYQLEEGSVATSYTPYTEDKRTLTLANPLRKVSATVLDKYAEGQVTRNISNWVTLDGSLGWSWVEDYIGYKRFSGGILPLALSIGVVNGIKNNGTQLSNTTSLTGSDQIYLSGSSTLNILVNDTDSGFFESYVPSNAEVKAYFYGYKMCHSDGVSPYQINEVPYNPTTWAEWTKPAGVVGDSTGLEFTADGSTYITSYIPINMKTNTKYGYLINVASTSLIGNFNLDATGLITGSSVLLPTPTVAGNKKVILTSQSTISTNRINFSNYNTEPLGNKIKFKDIRIFELPTGSQIESDFNTLTADQLTAKYLFYGLNPKNWKSVVDGSGQTATLPTALAPNYTPYKMLYQLATPTTEAVTTTPINAYDFGSILVDGGSIPAKTNILTGGLLPATSTSWLSASKTNVETLNGTCLSVTSNALGNIPQIKVKFNIIDMLEQKYGSLPCPNDIASKVAWVKANLNSILCSDYVYGLGASGNKANLQRWNSNGSGYESITSNLSSTPALTTTTIPSGAMDRIDSNGFVHYINYADQSSTTNSTTLALKAHGLAQWDFVENVTRGIIAQVNAIGGTDRLSNNIIVGQASGDVINKYHQTSSKTLEVGTTTTNIKITNHGLSTGDLVQNGARSVTPQKIIVVDANNFTITTPITGQTSGDTLYIFKYTGQQTAESTIIPSTINMDYISLDVALKPVTGYDMLSPEITRRDDGKSNIVLIKKEVKEIKAMFPTTGMDGIVVYGDYNPKVGILPPSSLVGGYSLVAPKAYLTTLTTRNPNIVMDKNTNFDLLNEFKIIDNAISTASADGNQLYTDEIWMNSLTVPTTIKGFLNSNSRRELIGKITLIGSNALCLDGFPVSTYIDISAFSPTIKMCPLLTFLAKDVNGVMYILIMTTDYLIPGKSFRPSASAGTGAKILAFKMTNNPLIK